jgi:hypothetical protein
MMDMIVLLLSIAAVVVVMGAVGEFALKHGAEDRPGFDERAPLS